MITNWAWRKSSRSATSGDCVEVGTSPDTPMVAIRDSKLGDGRPTLTFTPAEIGAFLHGVKHGEFSDLA
jgi:Domain of unknown function (DUF397)